MAYLPAIESSLSVPDLIELIDTQRDGIDVARLTFHNFTMALIDLIAVDRAKEIKPDYAHVITHLQTFRDSTRYMDLNQITDVTFREEWEVYAKTLFKVREVVTVERFRRVRGVEVLRELPQSLTIPGVGILDHTRVRSITDVFCAAIGLLWVCLDQYDVDPRSREWVRNLLRSNGDFLTRAL